MTIIYDLQIFILLKIQKNKSVFQEIWDPIVLSYKYNSKHQVCRKTVSTVLLLTKDKFTFLKHILIQTFCRQPYTCDFFNFILSAVQSSGLNSGIAEEHRNLSVFTVSLTQHACQPGGNETEKENRMRAYLNFVFFSQLLSWSVSECFVLVFSGTFILLYSILLSPSVHLQPLFCFVLFSLSLVLSNGSFEVAVA